MQRFKMGPVTGSRIWRHEPVDETVNPECTTGSLVGNKKGEVREKVGSLGF